MSEQTQQAISEAEPMTLIGGTAGLHMAQCNGHGFTDCPLLKAALKVVMAREQDAALAAARTREARLRSALESIEIVTEIIRAALADTPEGSA